MTNVTTKRHASCEAQMIVPQARERDRAMRRIPRTARSTYSPPTNCEP